MMTHWNHLADAVIEKLMVGVSPNLYWTCQRNKIEWKRLRRDQIGTTTAFISPESSGGDIRGSEPEGRCNQGLIRTVQPNVQ
jgi:hypothetical protein